MPSISDAIFNELLGVDETVNAVTRIVSNPCNSPWTVYTETALPAAGNAALKLFSTNPEQAIRGFARPKGTGSGRHRSRGRRRRRLPIFPPELGDEAGKRVPGGDDFRGRKVTDGVKTLWKVDNAIQRGLFWWMIVDVVDGFFIEWSSLLQQETVCERTLNGAAAATDAIFGEPQTGSINDLAFRDPEFIEPDLEWVRDFSGDIVGLETPLRFDFSYNVTLSVTFTTSLLFEDGIIRLVMTDPAEFFRVKAATEFQPISALDTVSLVLNTEMPSPQLWRFGFESLGLAPDGSTFPANLEELGIAAAEVGAVRTI